MEAQTKFVKKRSRPSQPFKSSKPSLKQPKEKTVLQTIKYLAINTFLVFDIFAIVCWAVPINTPFLVAGKELVRPYVLWTGLFQSWDMFAPNPKSQNMYLEAVIIYKDGSTELWTFPRMEFLSLTQRYFKERYRKYEDTLDDSTFALLWPDAARYIARMKRNHASPAQKIMLVVRSSAIIPRDDGGYDRGPWGARVLYSYDVRPEDLQ